MFQQHRDETLHTAKHRVMNHHRPLAFVALVDELRIEPLRQHEIELDRAALPAAFTAVRQMKLQFRAIESALSFEHVELEARCPRCICQRLFRAIPRLIVARAHRGPRGERDFEGREAEVRIDRSQQRTEAANFGFDMRFRAEHMRIVLHERARTLESFKRPRRFVTMTRAELAITNR